MASRDLEPGSVPACFILETVVGATGDYYTEGRCVSGSAYLVDCGRHQQWLAHAVVVNSSLKYREAG